jgi:hypothetical protein
LAGGPQPPRGGWGLLVSTVRRDGRPHATPLIAVWLDGALYFCTGPEERKARNLAHNPHCILTTGCNALDEGLDIVVEGDARPIRDETKLQRIADEYVSKYGPDWRFGVRDGAFLHEGAHEGSIALVFQVEPVTVFGFRKGEEFSQTRWRVALAALRRFTSVGGRDRRRAGLLQPLGEGEG